MRNPQNSTHISHLLWINDYLTTKIHQDLHQFPQKISGSPWGSHWGAHPTALPRLLALFIAGVIAVELITKAWRQVMGVTIGCDRPLMGQVAQMSLIEYVHIYINYT